MYGAQYLPAPDPINMSKIVMKFGGTSVADLDRIRHVAKIVKTEVDQGHQIAVVVSAMAGETNKLVGWTQELSAVHNASEYDVILASAEQVSVGLVAVALGAIGVSARSWLGWQIPIQTSDIHGSARILDVQTDLLNQYFEQYQVAVIAGFQGITDDNRITTLGRGGSDTSAVALAAALDAERCDIYTDVDGVYTMDPRVVPKAKRLERVSYEEMLELASLGAKVLQTRSVELAMLHRVPLRVLSAFDDDPGGTLLCDEDDIVEQNPVTGIAYSRDEAKITLLRVPDQPGVAAAIFGPLADSGVNVDMIVQNVSEDGQKTDLTFTVNRSELEIALLAIRQAEENIGYEDLVHDAKVAKVSIIGIGMRTNVGIAQTMFKTLSEKGINIQVISTSEIKVSLLIAEECVELAVRELHSVFDLDTK
jgi:aspartate kinase